MSSKLDRLLSQGRWEEIELANGAKVPTLVMPTPELQAELNDALNAAHRKRLKSSGWRRIYATERDHPFHSELLRERIDRLAYMLADDYDPTFYDDKVRDSYWETLSAHGESDVAIAHHIAQLQQTYRRGWAKAFGKYRDMLREPNYWRGTHLYKIVFPPDGPPLPDGPPPKPVHVKKKRDLVLSLNDGAINLWCRV